MKHSDGIKLASAAALLLAGCTTENATASAEVATGGEGPVKVAHCEGVVENDLVSISSGNQNFSNTMCMVLGGSAAGELAMQPGEHVGGGALQVTYCNDVFTCAGLSACKGNDNAACAAQNDCHAIGFVGVYSSEKSLSDELCVKLGGTVLSSL